MNTLSGPMLPPRSGEPPKKLMVLLHGYGADGSDLISLGYQWRDLWPDMLFVAPNAPSPCAMNPVGFEWFPLSGKRIAGRIDGAAAARPVLVNFLIDVWAQTGLGAQDTVLVGFSQGAMLALHVGTSLDRAVAGVVAFSGAFIPDKGFGTADYAKPPVALIHGEVDGVVEAGLSREAADELRAAGFEVSLHMSPGVGHGIAEDGLEFATEFLMRALGPKA